MCVRLCVRVCGLPDLLQLVDLLQRIKSYINHYSPFLNLKYEFRNRLTFKPSVEVERFRIRLFVSK